MAWKVYLKDYYFVAEQDGGAELYHEFHSKEVRIAKKFTNDTVYSFYQNHSGLEIKEMQKVPISDILDEFGIPYGVPAFDDWIKKNTGQWGTLNNTTLTQNIEYSGKLEPYCDTTGNIVAFATLKYDEQTGIEVPAYYDINLLPIASLPAGAVPCHDKAFNLVLDEWLPICKNGVQYFRQYRYIVDNSDGSTITTLEEWKDNNDATITPLNQPFEIGYCQDLFSTQYQKTYYTIGNTIFEGFISINSDGTYKIYNLNLQVEPSAILVSEPNKSVSILNQLRPGIKNDHFEIIAGQTITLSGHKSINIIFLGDCEVTIGSKTITYEQGLTISYNAYEILQNTIIINCLNNRAIINTL